MHAWKTPVDLAAATPPSRRTESGASVPPPAALGPKRSGFAELESILEQCLRQPSSLQASSRQPGSDQASDVTHPIVVVRAEAQVLEHLAQHAVRKLTRHLSEQPHSERLAEVQAEQNPQIAFVSGARVDEPWREVVRYIEPSNGASTSEFSAKVSPSESAFGEGAARAASPRDIAERIAASSCDAIVIVDATMSSFGRAVLGNLAEIEMEQASGETVAHEPGARPRAPMFVFTSSQTSGATSWNPAKQVSSGVVTIDVDARLDTQEIRAWWASVTHDFDRLPNLDRLDSLASWWRAASATPADASPPVLQISPTGERLLSRLTLAGRAWPLSSLIQLGARESHVQELKSLGLVSVANGLVAVTNDFAGARVDLNRAGLSVAETNDLSSVAHALGEVFQGDPWATMRSAELLAAELRCVAASALAPASDPAPRSASSGSTGSTATIEAMAMRSIASVVDSETREDLWRRYRALVIDIGTEGGRADVASCLRTADLALRIGDVDRAVEFSRLAASSDAESPDVLLTLGRATAATGDLTTATVTIAKAMARCDERSSVWARAAVELAEVRYTTGELVEARELADRGFDAAGSPSVRLAARNVIGKVLLAKAAYSEADRHFASDACDAACAGESVAELRARLNRAIALMSASRHDEARVMLESVLELGEERAEVKAVCFALGNLATIAILQHRYAEALALLERTIDIVRRIGDKPRLAVFITNLAELRLRLGLEREAEQLLLFGRRVCGITSPRFAQFSLVSARIQLSRGRTVEAMRDVGTAMAGSGVGLVPLTQRPSGQPGLSSSGASGSGLAEKEHRGWSGFLGLLVLECLRMAARAALEDGDTRRATEFLDRATHENGTPHAKAEVATLRAACARASGEAFADLADDALAAARDADDEELMRESLLLAHHAAVADHDPRRADLQLDAAIALRNQVAESLPEWIRERYLARRELGELARLEAAREGQRSRTLVSDFRDSVRPESGNDSFRVDYRAEQRPRGSRKIVGNDPSVRSLLAAIQKVGRSETIVLVHGESGTGKELVAEALHEASQRSSGPLVKVNCAALVETLLLSELFGHEKGAFTGAAGRRRGRFEAADGGTLFLDEIGDISARTQVALLRVLQEKTFERVGGTTSIRSNVRVICATHRDLKSLVAKGEFREDLYYRLCGVVLEVPALRQRRGDLGAVAEALLGRIADERGAAPKSLSPNALIALSQHNWPGNIRELENALRAASLFAESDQIEVEDFTDNVESLRALAVDELGMPPAAPESVAGRTSTTSRTARDSMARDSMARDSLARDSVAREAGTWGPSSGPQTSRSACGSTPPPANSSPTDVAYAHVRSGVSLSDMKKQIEHDCIARALSETDGNITRAASLLGMKRPRLSQLVKQYGLGGEGEGSWSGEIDEEGEEA